MTISVFGSAVTTVASFSMSAAVAMTQGIPRVAQLPKKISAKLWAMTALKPPLLIA